MLAISEITFLKMKFVEGYIVRKKQELVKTMPAHFEVEAVTTTNKIKNTIKLFVNANKHRVIHELNSIDKGTNIIVVMSIIMVQKLWKLHQIWAKQMKYQIS